MKKTIRLSLVTICLAASVCYAQRGARRDQPQAATGREDALRLTATGDKYMTFYVVSEKLPQGFTPKTTLEVVDNRGKAQVTNNWVNRERPLIARADGLSQYGAVNQVEMNSMTMSRPYSADKNVEEIWIATEGDIDILLGKELRKIPVGTAFRVPSTGITAHAQINASGKPAKFISMVR